MNRPHNERQKMSKNIVLVTSRQEQPVDERHIFVTVGPNCWGKGDTIEEAFKNCKYNAPHGHRGHFITRVAPKDCGVDPIDGAVMWDSSHSKDCKVCTVGRGITVLVK